jgi:hypothetical protein
VVESSVNYLDEMDEMPVFYAQKTDNNLKLSTHAISVEDARGLDSRQTLEREGFGLFRRPTAVGNFRDTDEVMQVYRPEIVDLLTGLTGARKVLVTGPVLRWSESSRYHGTLLNSRAARFVHIDYSRKSFDEFARRHLEIAGVEDVERWLRGRYAAYNFWRVLTPPPQDVPLGVCSARTVQLGDMVTGMAVVDPPNGPELRFESSLIRFNPAHRWFYYPRMRPDEVLVFKAFDSDRASLQGCPHSAFDDPSCPTGVEPRGSVEIRAYAYYG